MSLTLRLMVTIHAEAAELRIALADATDRDHPTDRAVFGTALARRLTALDYLRRRATR